ncbi:MAG: hypothetical protein KJO49_04230 [Bacteroidia bacterium]|nr:hypothetical protein [Bacteroidia bacterium]MBT8269717.1 hypothetical protein [Bacteroidia bacterium]NNF83134.1 hypothetical protein [Flavobacteriaceae bacterium]NNK71129.1 hypothetical protein [Flavobacteriaceae bacterium]NNL80779.1 hypothetical protein [Flavobacteriaceae bacterium]
MPVIQENILHYKVDIRSGRFAANFPAYIHGYNKKDKHILTCVFFENLESVLPENKRVDAVVTMYFYMNKFSLVLDIFRNESPLKIVYDTKGKDCTLITELEPVGEGE